MTQQSHDLCRRRGSRGIVRSAARLGSQCQWCAQLSHAEWKGHHWTGWRASGSTSRQCVHPRCLQISPGQFTYLGSLRPDGGPRREDRGRCGRDSSNRLGLSEFSPSSTPPWGRIKTSVDAPDRATLMLMPMPPGDYFAVISVSASAPLGGFDKLTNAFMTLRYTVTR